MAALDGVRLGAARAWGGAAWDWERLGGIGWGRVR